MAGMERRIKLTSASGRHSHSRLDLTALDHLTPGLFHFCIFQSVFYSRAACQVEPCYTASCETIARERRWSCRQRIYGTNYGVATYPGIGTRMRMVPRVGSSSSRLREEMTNVSLCTSQDSSKDVREGDIPDRVGGVWWSQVVDWAPAPAPTS